MLTLIIEHSLHHQTIPLPRSFPWADKNHRLFPIIDIQVPHNIIMGLRYVKLSLPNILPHIAETCGCIEEGVERRRCNVGGLGDEEKKG